MRAQSELEIRILDMIEPEAKALGLDVVRVRIIGSQSPTLQIMAERPDGTMTVESCAKFSRAISPVLETEDPIAGEYHLEVSSPGIDRPLTREGDFAKWVGHETKVELGTPTPEGRKRFHGWIVGEADGVLELTLKDGGEAKVIVADMVKAHLMLTDKLIQDARARGQAPVADVEEDEIAESLGDDFDDVEVENIDDGLDAEADGPVSDNRSR
ncbi:MAG: ribosome maturation factor RimP [Hyphomonadaceae bacterium]|nr:ribosome maturation factor RimP [Hyphomonadaceae bacterium]